MARVLVVDNMPDSRAFLRAVLGSVGHEVLEAADGVEALEILRNKGADVVMSDGLMPRMDGFRLCLEMRRDPELAVVPFIFHTASFTHGDDARLAEQLGAEAYLVKPVPLERILDCVRGALERPAGETVEPIDDAALVALLERYGERLESKLRSKVVELGEAAEARESFRMLLDNLPLVVVTFAPGGSVDFCNREALEFSAERDRGVRGFLAVCSHVDASRFLAAARAALIDETPGEVSLSLRRRDGHRRTISFSIVPYYGQDGECLGAVAAGLDVTEEQEHTALLRYLTEHDPLTDLPNRRVLDAKFEDILQRVAEGRKCAVLFADVDRFKSVNDEFGHDVGDAALVNIARVLESAAGEDALVVRLCGDEFAVLVEDAGWEEADGIAERIRTSVSQAALVPGASEKRLTVSIGVTIVPDAGSPGEALRESDRAMYSAKASGRDRTALGRDRPPEDVSSDLRRVLFAPRMTFAFSPVYSLETSELARCSVRTVCEVAGERVSDEEYMARSARHGVGRLAGRRVIEAVLGLMSGTDRACSVNLWLADLLDPTVFAWVEESAGERGVEPARVGFNVPAAYIIGSAPSVTWLKAAERSRVRLILDVGASDLAKVAGLAIECFDEIAVPAAALVEGTAPYYQRESMLRAASARGLASTLTGVDSRDVLAYAIDLGVDNAQGSVLCRTVGALGEVPPRI